ncbi:MAG: proteasome accessory factor PafA2 [Bifidobacteriaceae bacterium]|nr:proteasome accessory factor PafA2 [Bifidobacteriaceae bacterium]
MTEIVLGIETEYGVLGPVRNPVELSSWVVAAYKAGQSGRVAPWDYRSEDPHNDARGFRLDQASAHQSPLMAEPDQGGARPVVEKDGPGAAMLANGGRLYVDHAHPEYASPETATAREVSLWDQAGQRIMASAAWALADAGQAVSLYKNNTDGQGASYGTHENYLVERSVAWELLVAVITPFLVTRQIYTGSGRAGLGQRSQDPGFQLSQRADFVEAEVGLETTLNRPIVNTRDEPHADPERWRRLHVIVGDATMMEVATYVRLGVTGLILRAMTAAPRRAAALAEEVRLDAPVGAFVAVSRDLTLREPLAPRAGGQTTAVGIQRRYHDFVAKALPLEDPETRDLMDRWAALLDGLGSDPMTVSRQVEWVAKYQLLESLRQRDGLAWDHPKLRAADLKWTDVNPKRSLFARVMRHAGVETLFEEREIAWAVTHPPTSTRAYLKGEVISRYPDNVVAAGWDSLSLAWPGGQARLNLSSPLAGNRAQIEAVLAESASGPDLVDRLAGVDLG